MSNNKDFKVKNGIQPTSYFESVGTVVSGFADGYDLVNASYDSVSFSVASQDSGAISLSFKSDGTKMYILGGLNDSVYQYSLSTSFDLSTASYDSVSFSVASQATGAGGIFFKPDGTKMYIIGNTTDSVYQYSLSTAWDLSTASYDSVSFSVASQDTNVVDIFFKPDGTKMYILGGGYAYQYSLSTAWDLSTASYDSVSSNLRSQDLNNRGIFFKPDGTKMYATGLSDFVYQYSLSTAWDLSTASYDNVSFSVVSQDASPVSLAFSSDGTKMYMVGTLSDTVFQYTTALNAATLDLSTGSVFEITPTSGTQVTLSNPADSGTVSSATLVINYAKSNVKLASQEQKAVFDTSAVVVGSEQETVFKTDGTKMYVLDSSEDIYQFTLSTAWDVSTASSDSVSFTLTQGATANDIYFKPDGTKLYSLDGAAAVYQYSLSTAWDVSTASYDSVSFATVGEVGSLSMEFSADGTSLYIGGAVGNGIDQYTLSTAWDLSTAGSGVFTSFGEDMDCIAFSSDGVYLATVSLGATAPLVDHVKLYKLSTPWDVSTAVAVNDGTMESQYNATTNGITFGDDDKSFYITSSNKVLQYVSAEAYTITYAAGINFKATPFTLRPDETDVVVFRTRDGGTSYTGTLVIDGAK